MTKKITKTAEKIKEDVIKLHQCLTKRVQRLENELESYRIKGNYNDMTPKKRRNIQVTLSHIANDHAEIQALETILFKK